MIHDLVLNDMSWRFRPFYWVERVVCTALFGADMYGWNVYTALKGVLAFALLVLVARNLKCNRITSLIFSAIIIVGPQFTPWYRSANQENTGLLLTALAFWMCSLQSTGTRKHRRLWNSLIWVVIVVCGLVKESFTLMMPALAAFHWWIHFSREEKSIWKSIKASGIFYLAVLAVFINHVCWIVFGSGLDNVSYAGFHEGTSLSTYFYGIRDSLFVYMKWYSLMGILLIAVVVMCYQYINRKVLSEIWGLFLISIFIMGVQLLAHAKSLMWERYIIPFIIGYAFLFVVIGYRFFAQDVIRRKIYTVFLTVLLLQELPAAYRG